MALAAKSFSDLITFTRASTAGYYGSDGLYKTAASGVARTGTYADYKPADITQQNILTYSSGFDNAAWTKSNGFVQTNLLLYSQDFTNVYWGKSNCTISASAQTAPDGTATASLITTTTTAFTYLNVSSYVAAATSAINTFVVSVMAGTVNSISLGLYDGTTFGSGSAVIVSGPGTLTQQTGSRFLLSGLSTSQWTRVAITRTTVSAGTGLSPFMYPRDQSASNAGDTLHIWGAQLVQGSVAGDYRATTSAALPILYADPLGTTLAQKFCENNAVSVQHTPTQTVTLPASSAVTVSVYLKAGERTQARVLNYDAGTNYYGVIVNLLDGSVVTTVSGGTVTNTGYTITAVGGGWYRVTVTATIATGARQFYVNPAQVGGGVLYTGDGSSGIYMFGAQINEGATALPYLATTATGGHATTTGAKRGFLVEEQRTNLLVRSNDWSATWNLLNITQTPAQAIGPDGTMSMTKIAATATAVSLCAQASVATSTSQTYSIYAKQGSGPTEANYFAVYNNTTSTNLAMLTINYGTGVITQTNGTGAYAENVGNGIWRIVVPVTSGITVGNSINGYFGFVGGPETAGEYAYAYGAQMEAGTFATSYIPTTTSQVTRAGDVPRIDTVSPWYNSAEGTLYVEVVTQLSNTQNQFLATFSDGTTQNRAGIFKSTAGISGFRLLSGGASANPTGPANALTGNTTHKAALSFTTGSNNVTCATNGALGTAATTTNMPVGINRLSLGIDLFLTNDWINGHLRAVRYYPRRFTNAELQALTA